MRTVRAAIWLVFILALVILPTVGLYYALVHESDWEHPAEYIKTILESAAIACGAWALFHWIVQRRDRATDILLKLDEEFDKRCKNVRDWLEVDREYDKKKGALDRAVRDKERPGDANILKDVDDYLHFYIVLHSVVQHRQVPEESLSDSFQYWLAHYYRNNRHEFRRYVNELFPVLREWLLRDTTLAGRFVWNPWSKWWRPFFRPQDFMRQRSNIELDPNKLYP
jgi:hypothetical protein